VPNRAPKCLARIGKFNRRELTDRESELCLKYHESCPDRHLAKMVEQEIENQKARIADSKRDLAGELIYEARRENQG
jgi:hypothetical protein